MSATESTEPIVRDVTRDPLNPELYPPRVLPKSIKRRPRDNRMIIASQPVEDHILFSGFYHNEHHHDTTRYRFRELIGKQNVAQELDLIAYVQPRQEMMNAHGNKHNHHHVAVQQIKFVGTALATFPHELRCHFSHLLINSVHHSRIVPGTTLQQLHTHLGPFALATNTPPSHFSNFDFDKHRMMSTVATELLNHAMAYVRPRYLTRFLTHTVQKQKKYKRSKRASVGKDEDGEEGGKKSKKREDGEESEGEHSGEESQTSDESDQDDYDFRMDNDDDDDDNDGGSGNDEPTF